jgi:hypothetical protein
MSAFFSQFFLSFVLKLKNKKNKKDNHELVPAISLNQLINSHGFKYLAITFLN